MAAYAILFVMMVILTIGLLTGTMNIVYNEFIDLLNPVISAGEVSDQFVTYWKLFIGIVIAVPLLVLFAVSIWAYVRVIERRQEEGP